VLVRQYAEWQTPTTEVYGMYGVSTTSGARHSLRPEALDVQVANALPHKVRVQSSLAQARIRARSRSSSTSRAERCPVLRW
jgi:hypothetical protein